MNTHSLRDLTRDPQRTDKLATGATHTAGGKYTLWPSELAILCELVCYRTEGKRIGAAKWRMGTMRASLTSHCLSY